MSRLTKAVLSSAAVFAAATAVQAGPVNASAKRCEVIRILPDGREIRTMSAKGTASGWGNGAGASSVSVTSRSGSARSSSSASASSSSSASASSSSGSRGTARAVSSYTDDEGRTVTTTRDNRGCTVVIDER